MKNSACYTDMDDLSSQLRSKHAMIARLRRWVHRRIVGEPTTPLSVLRQRSKLANERIELALAEIERAVHR